MQRCSNDTLGVSVYTLYYVSYIIYQERGNIKQKQHNKKHTHKKIKQKQKQKTKTTVSF